tara:strand:+ start:260 stop:574 length:315 start_codon:yes stop_codon:yes gene_type:complete
MKKISFYFIVLSIFLTSCQSVKDGLSGRKNDNSDEFLVQKKNPLVMPPKFMELPSPDEEIIDTEIEDSVSDVNIQNILDLDKSSDSKQVKSGSAEDYVLKKIKD